MLLLPLDFVPSALPLRAFSEPDPRLLEVCVLTCEALVTFAVSVAGRPCRQ